MRWSQPTVLFLGFWAFPATNNVMAADVNPAEADEQTLKEAKLPLDGPGLLEFFRKRTPSEGFRDKVQALVRKLGDDSFDVREKASQELTTMGAQAVPFLRQALSDPDPEIKHRAEACLQQIGEKAQNSAILAAAARQVGRKKTAGTALVLLAYFPSADEDGITEEIQSALAAVALREGKPEQVLVAALTDKNAARRGVAAAALWQAGAAEQRPAIRKLLKDPNPTVRLQVALAMVHGKEKEGVPVLIDLIAELPLDRVWMVHDFLVRLAEEQAPAVSPGPDAAERRQCRDAWAAWWREQGSKIDLAKLDLAPKMLGYTLVLLLEAGEIIELDAHDKPRWKVSGLLRPLDAQILPGERLLVTEFNGNRITERNTKGDILWEKQIQSPLMAQRLANGNTFIATYNQLLEVDRAGKEIYSLTRGQMDIMKACKLPNGQIAYVSQSQQRFIRLDTTGKELQSFPVTLGIPGGRIHVLPNGHVVIPEMNNNKVVEYDPQGKVVWEIPIEGPIAAVRLPNGNTLITFYYKERGVEVDRKGKVVWEYKATTTLNRLFRR